MGKLIDVDKLKDVLEYAILANVPADDANTKEEKWNDWIQSVIDTAPTVEAIPKADYENRLKADMVAMLTELQLEIEENVLANDPNTLLPFLQVRETCVAVIQQKINALKENI